MLLCLLCSLFSACEANDHNSKEEPARTLLFYMGGDNNLSAEVNARIDKITAVPLSPYCRVFIYADTSDSPPQLSEVVAASGGNTLNVLRKYREENSADAEVFASALREIRELSPASAYGLILFSHATGWLPTGAYSNPQQYQPPQDETSRSVILDGNSEMEIAAFATAIPDEMFDFIIFEACYMAGVDVAWELKDKTRYLVASSAELVSPGFSGCYDKALPHLYKEQADLAGFCTAIETDYATRRGDYASLTLSLIDTQGLENLALVIRELGLPVANGIENIQAFDRGGKTVFLDLIDSYPEIEETQKFALQTAIEGCVGWKTATSYFMPSYGGFAVEVHCGLTTYILQERYPKLNEAYRNLKWYGVIQGDYATETLDVSEE